jgi:hypothetical protein
MKTNLVTLVIIFSFSIEACSTTYVLTKVPQQTPYFTTQYMSYEELMAKADGETVTIVMRDGNQQRGILSYANPDSIAWAEIGTDPGNIAWTDFTTGAFHKVPTSQVHHLELVRNFAWEGGAIGLLLLTIPPLVGGGWAPQYPSRHDEPDYSWRSIIVMGGVFGGVAGFGIGSQIKETQEFHVVPAAGQRKTKSDSPK